MIASGHGGGCCSPLSASGIGRAAGEPGASCGRMWGCFLSPILPLSLKCGCCLLSLGSAASSFPPVVSWSGHSLGWLRLLQHRERGLGCTLRLSMEIQPLGCCFDDCLASARPWPVHRLAVALGRFLTLDLVVRCSSTSGDEIEFWCLGTLGWSPVYSTLR